MSRSLSFHRGLLLIAFLSLSPLVANAQFRASLRGTVTDPQGAAVPEATVTLTNTATNQKFVATSDANGIYQFNALGPAPYSLSAEHAGFKKKVLDYVQIIPEQLNSLDVQLDVGEVQQTVTVSGTTQTLDTETATVSGTVSSVLALLRGYELLIRSTAKDRA
jgi:hypothetical protein